jgi:hypothetical protein
MAMGYYNDDPLGIGLKMRALEHNRQYAAKNRELARANGQLVSFSNLGPLPDLNMEAFKQSLFEAGADKIQAPGLTPSSLGNETTATIDNQSVPYASAEKQRMGYDIPNMPSMGGLRRAGKRKR